MEIGHGSNSGIEGFRNSGIQEFRNSGIQELKEFYLF
jgi:hypothetical protein